MEPKASKRTDNSERVKVDKFIKKEIKQYYDAKNNSKTEKFENKFCVYSDYSAILEKYRRIAEEYDTKMFDEEEFNKFLLFQLIKRQEILNYDLNNVKRRLIFSIILLMAATIFNIYMLWMF